MKSTNVPTSSLRLAKETLKEMKIRSSVRAGYASATISNNEACNHTKFCQGDAV